MTRVEEIEERLRTLSPSELQELRAWLDEFEAQAWDRQIEADSAAGRLDDLIQRALNDEQEGKTTLL